MVFWMWNVRLPQRLQRVWVLFRLLPAWRQRGWVEAKAQQLHNRHQVHHELTDPHMGCHSRTHRRTRYPCRPFPSLLVPLKAALVDPARCCSGPLWLPDLKELV